MHKFEWLSFFSSLFLLAATIVIVTVYGNPPLIEGWQVHNIPEMFLLFSVGVFCSFSFFAENKWKLYLALFWGVYAVVVAVGSLIVGFDAVVFAVIIPLPFPIGYCLGTLYKVVTNKT
ncbi:MAG: hypothetical protein JSV85_07820 [Candidatus Bathyarchaeota archaeon]|nr:MAG: hypothetical protein JSV85_07820 [Candidatus Bathyarchaeota archaeon]